MCGYTEYEDTDIDMDAHLWEDDYTVDKEPTCTANGSKSIHCARCGVTKDSTVIPVIDHTYGEWETVTPATCTENGVKKRVCTVCGYEQTDVTEAAHEWESTRTIDILHAPNTARIRSTAKIATQEKILKSFLGRSRLVRVGNAR